MQESSEPKKHLYRSWLIAFFAPCLILGMFGAWLGHGEFAESVGKNYSMFGQVPGPSDAWAMSAEFFLMLGLPAGLLGLSAFAIYRFLRRGSAATKH